MTDCRVLQKHQNITFNMKIVHHIIPILFFFSKLFRLDHSNHSIKMFLAKLTYLQIIIIGITQVFDLNYNLRSLIVRGCENVYYLYSQRLTLSRKENEFYQIEQRHSTYFLFLHSMAFRFLRQIFNYLRFTKELIRTKLYIFFAKERLNCSLV